MQLQRSKWKAFSEGLIEWTIRVSGISAVVFVFAVSYTHLTLPTKA